MIRIDDQCLGSRHKEVSNVDRIGPDGFSMRKGSLDVRSIGNEAVDVSWRDVSFRDVMRKPFLENFQPDTRSGNRSLTVSLWNGEGAIVFVASVGEGPDDARIYSQHRRQRLL